MKKFSLYIVILIMSIGFAMISTNLIIKGKTSIKENKEDFEIIFTSAKLDNEDVYEDVISEDKKKITFTSNDLKKLNDTSVLNYEVTNNSNNYDAEVKINCNAKDAVTAEYTSITNVLNSEYNIVYAKETVDGNVTITLNKVSTTELTEEYVCILEFNALERDSLGYSGPYEWDFSYTGDEQEFVVPVSGTYRIETWGAQGGNASSYFGGYGGYSSGLINLRNKEKLYINIGGSGSSGSAIGGYNGGGASKGCENRSRYAASGGGATHIATSSGLLSTLENKINNILIVSGGGGGAFCIWVSNGSSVGHGGSAGGYIGNSSSFINTGVHVNYDFATGGTQTIGGLYGNSYNDTVIINENERGAFGLGAEIISETECDGNDSSGGGGGFYGGGSGFLSSAAGGSGYIGNSSLTDKSMYCYNCTESEDESTKTISTTCASETPTENCSKIGNGYARITLIS